MKKPAFLGGTPAFPEGPPSWPIHDADVATAIQKSLSDGTWGKYHGPCHGQLSQKLADWHDVEFVTLCCSGTMAVELALRGLAVGEGDEVILAGYDFPGNFRAVEATGAKPVLVDVDPRTWSLDPQQLQRALSPKTCAVLVSHLHGGTASMQAIVDFAKQADVRVLEDACQSPMARIDGKLSGTWGDVAVLSFGGSKLLSAGRGGAVLTKLPEVHQRIKVFADRGNQAFPLSELQAAVLLPQMDKLPERNALRARNVKRLLNVMSESNWLRPIEASTANCEPAYYKLAWHVESQLGSSENDRQLLINAMQAEGLAIDSGFRGFTRRSERRCRKVGELPNSQRAADRTLLLHHPLLLQTENTIDLAAKTICQVAQVLSSMVND